MGFTELMNINLASVTKSISPTILLRASKDDDMIDPDTWIMDVTTSQVINSSEITFDWYHLHMIS